MIGSLLMSNAPSVEQGEMDSYTKPASDVGMQPSHWLITLVAVLVIMHFLGMSKNTRIDPAHVHIGGYNAITITLIAILGITGAKVLFNKIYVVGLTELVNAA